ncbi:MAG: ParA family protein, partial [Pseudomonadota bacterium]
RPALREADLVIVPVSASHLDLWATEAVLDLVDRTNSAAVTVLNRARTGTRLTAEITEQMEALPAPVAATVLGNRVVYAEALGAGLGVCEKARTGAAAKEIEALAENLVAMV